MSKSTTPDLDLNHIQLQNLLDFRDRRVNNVNYVRNVLRKFFSSYIKKSSTSSDENQSDHLISPILIHPCLQFDKHSKFSGSRTLNFYSNKFVSFCR